MKYKLLIVVNKDEGFIGPSETFLHAHINGLPADVITMVGNPGYRCLDASNNKYLQSRSLIPLGFRWLVRKFGFSTVLGQDRNALSKFIQRNKISAVMAEYGTTAVTVMEACHDVNVPLIAHFHGWDAYSHHLLAKHAVDYQRLFKLSSAIIAVSQHMREQLISLGANPDITYHNACGAEISDDIKAQPDNSECRFVMVGRLTGKKAPFISLIAFSEVVKKHPHAFFDVIGDGQLKEACVQLCEALGISNVVKFHGAQPHSKVIDILSKANCFVQHSVTTPSGDREGTPVGVLEAMGMGLPVVTTRHGGIIDIIEDGKTGLLVDEYELVGMVQAMLNFASDEKYAREIGRNARSAVLTNWTDKKSNDRLWNIIERSL